MTLEEIKKAVESGKKVFWSHDGYEVIKDKIGQWLIVCHKNNHCIGLTYSDNTTLNGKEGDFFIEGTMKIIGERAVLDHDITEDEAIEIFERNPNITQIDTIEGYYPRP
jgi:hypothetical protein